MTGSKLHQYKQEQKNVTTETFLKLLFLRLCNLIHLYFSYNTTNFKTARNLLEHTFKMLR